MGVWLARDGASLGSRRHELVQSNSTVPFSS
jgi:hypothetical protein